MDLSSALVDMLMGSSIEIISFFERSSLRLLLELHCVYIVVIKHVAFFTISATLTMTFTLTSYIRTFYTCFSMWLWFRIDGIGEETEARIGGFVCIPLTDHPPHLSRLHIILRILNIYELSYVHLF